MGVVANAYQRLQLALLPAGDLWRMIGEAFIPELFLGASDELERLDARAWDLLNESVPSKAVELLAEYEEELGIDAAATTAERQARITARYLARQRYRPVDFQNALAPLLGLAPADVVVVERTRAQAVAMGDDREIFRFFIYRDPALAGTYYLDAAQDLVDKIKPSHTRGYVIESINFLCDDPLSLCDRDILGA